MQAVILAAGRGQRLAPLTDHLPKCLVPIGDRPLLDYQIDALKKWGVDKICVVAGSHKDKVEEFLKIKNNVRLVENPEFRTTNIIVSFWYALGALDLSDDFLVMAGDLIFEDSIVRDLKEASKGELTLCIAKKSCGEEEVKVRIEGGQVIQLGKKLDPQTSFGEFLGVFKASRSVMGEIKEIVDQMVSSKEVQSYLFDLINRFIHKKKKVTAFEIRNAFWEDIDFLEDIQRVERWFTLRNMV